MAEYYLSNGGNDTLTGADIGNAWETINKLNTDVTEAAQGLEPADAVRLDRGSEWEETLNLPTQNDGTLADPIQMQPYGSGDRPVISGLKKLTGWAQVSGNIYELQDNGFVDSLLLLLNGAIRMKGRLPATGTLQYISAGTTSLEAGNLPNIDYSGGEVVAFVEKNDWIHDKSYISGRSGNVLTVVQASGYTGTRGQYYIENAIEALQADGDWMYSPSLQKYSIYSTVNPDTLDIYVPVRPNNVNALGNYYNRFEDIVFQGSYDIGFLASSSYYNIYQNLLIRNQGNIGMQLSTAKYCEIRNVTIENSLNLGAQVYNDSDFTLVEGNTFRNIGMWLGYSGSGDGKGSALFFRSNLDGGYTCRLNLIEDIGYLGIRFHGDDALVEKNILRRYCMVKHDGAGIYTYGGAPGTTLYVNRVVQKNLVFDGGIRARDAVYGIYIDDNSENVLIQDNAVVRSRRAGYYNHNSNNIQFRNNIVYAADLGYFFAQDNLGGVISDNEVSGNVFVITSKNHQAGSLKSDENILSTFFNLVNNNEYIVCSNQQIVFATRYVDGGKTIFDNLTFSQWQALGFDLNSSVRYLNLPEYSISVEGSNKFPGDGTFEGTLSDVSIYHDNGTAEVTRDTTSKINSTGSLKCSVTAASTSTTRVEVSFRNLGSIEFTKKYLLRFKALAPSGHQSLVIYARESGSPYHRLSSEIYAIADNTVREFEFLLSDLSDDDNGAILIEMQAHQGDLYIDDFEFKEVTAEYTDLESYVKVVYNDQDSQQSVALQGQWKDLDNAQYTETISLEAFESRVLLADAGVLFQGAAPTEVYYAWQDDSQWDYIDFSEAEIGDLMLAMVSLRGEPGVDDVVDPEGWTVLIKEGRVRIYGKIKEQEDPLKLIVARSGSQSENRMWNGAVLRNASLEGIVVGTRVHSDYSGDITLASMNAVVGSLAVVFSGSRWDANNTHQLSAGWTERDRVLQLDSIGTFGTKLIDSGTSTGPVTIQNSSDMEAVMLVIPYQLQDSSSDDSNVNASRLFKESFESGVWQWEKEGELNSTIYSGSGSSLISTEQAKTGTHSLKMSGTVVYDGTDDIPAQSNNFLYDHISENDDLVYDFSIFLPQYIDFETSAPISFFNLLQIKGVEDGVRNDPMWVLYLNVRGGKGSGGPNYLQLTYMGQFWPELGGTVAEEQTRKNEADIPLNDWFNIRMRIKKHQTEGIIQVWKVNSNGSKVLLFDVRNINTFPQNLVSGMQLSINNYGQATIPRTTHVYMDDVSIYQTNPGFNLVGNFPVIYWRGKRFVEMVV